MTRKHVSSHHPKPFTLNPPPPLPPPKLPPSSPSHPSSFCLELGGQEARTGAACCTLPRARAFPTVVHSVCVRVYVCVFVCVRVCTCVYTYDVSDTTPRGKHTTPLFRALGDSPQNNRQPKPNGTHCWRSRSCEVSRPWHSATYISSSCAASSASPRCR